MIQMFINNEEVVSNKEFTIIEEMLATSSTILNNCYPKTWEDTKDYVSNFYYPKDYSKCKILKDDNLIFCGVVKNTGSISLSPTDPKYCSLQILDFKTFLSEGEILDFVISDKTVKEAITMVVNAISDYGFVVGNIRIFDSDKVIGAYSTLNKSPYDVFQYLADITGSKWYTRTVDENTNAIDFYDPTLMTQKDNIEYTTEYFENNNIIDISFSYGTMDYRNKQVMLSDSVYADTTYNENFTADGYTNEYTLSQNVGKMISITSVGTKYTFASEGEKELGITADFYYSVESNTITHNSDREAISAGMVIEISYIPLIEGRQVIYNDDEISRINGLTNRKGVVARYETRNDVVDADELNSVGESYIKYKGTAEVILKIQTKDTDLFDIGNVVYFDAPIDDLKQNYMVKKKETKIIATGSDSNIFYTYELTSSYNSEYAINYFDNQRNKASGNISTGEFISRNVDIESEALIIFNNLSYSEQEFQNNVLDCILDSSFTE